MGLDKSRHIAGMVSSHFRCLALKAPSPQQLDVAFLKKNHHFPLGLQVYFVDESDTEQVRSNGQGKVIFSLNELPVGTSFLSPHGALIQRVKPNIVKVLDTEIHI